MLTIRNLRVDIGEQVVIDNLKLDLQHGQIGCLLGPSGAGKTTLLRAIAGFHPISAGQIVVADQLVDDTHKTLPVKERGVGVIFQDFALFPHMTVLTNISYGLSHLSATEQRARVDELLQLTDLVPHAHKYPHQLSGGQQQRVAIARALAPKPAVLLLDEAFSALDPNLRETVTRELRDLLKAQNTTALMITHDQQEAFAMADMIGLMHNKQIVQWASAADLYHQPNSAFVAKFIGEGSMISGDIHHVAQHKVMVNTSIGQFPVAPPYTELLAEQSQVEVLIRPDDIHYDATSPLRFKLVAKRFRGAHYMYSLANNDCQIMALFPSHIDCELGQELGVRLDLQHVACFPCN